MKEEMKK